MQTPCAFCLLLDPDCNLHGRGNVRRAGETLSDREGSQMQKHHPNSQNCFFFFLKIQTVKIPNLTFFKMSYITACKRNYSLIMLSVKFDETSLLKRDSSSEPEKLSHTIFQYCNKNSLKKFKPFL